MVSQDVEEVPEVVEPTEEEKLLSDIYKDNPALKNLGDVKLHADPNYTQEKTGTGTIEYFDKDQSEITYDNGFKYQHPKLGTNTIV